MGRINWGRVFVGGLVAGLIINLFEYVTNGVVLAANWDAPMKALGRHLPASPIPVDSRSVASVVGAWFYRE